MCSDIDFLLLSRWPENHRTVAQQEAWFDSPRRVRAEHAGWNWIRRLFGRTEGEPTRVPPVVPVPVVTVIVPLEVQDRDLEPVDFDIELRDEVEVGAGRP